MPILVTGAAGFIGAYACRALRARGEGVVGLDNYNDYYDPTLKHDRVAALCPDVDIRVLDLCDREGLAALFDEVRPRRVVHLAAQAGVRHSLQNPHTCVDSNLAGFVDLLELCRHRGVRHVVYASSSSVYGDSTAPPFSEDQRVDRPRSLYAATKLANELMAHAYAHVYGLRSTGLRFFTVYGAWGRPDMAPVLFPRAVLAGETVDVFNHGRMRRDFTHVDDIVAGLLGALDCRFADGDPEPPHRVFNLGNSSPVELEHFIAVVEQAAGRTARKRYLPMQPGDMVETMADTRRARAAFGFEPSIAVESGMPPVVDWCRRYFGEGAGNAHGEDASARHSPGKRSPGGHALEGHPCDVHASEGHASEGRASEGRASKTRAVGETPFDGRASGGPA